MAQTRMFRDRVVSMEQTLEGGEKHLELLKSLCSEALPEFSYAGHVLDHERDLFVLELADANGRRKTIAWTRMVLYDAERLPAIVADPAAPVREKLVGFLKARAARPDIVVTFRHVEDDWVDTPEVRPARRRGRRGGRGGRAQGQAPGGRPGFGKPAGAGGPGQQRPSGQRPPGREPLRADAGRMAAQPKPPGGGGPPAAPGGSAPRPGRRRRSRRRRRGGGGGQGGPPPAPRSAP
jgi:hypothetical protein